MHISWRATAVAGLILSGACSGSINCGGCTGGLLDPIPGGGFDPDARFERAAQVRVTRTGLDFVQNRFQDLTRAYVSMACGAPGDVPCPNGFRSAGGGTVNTTCDPFDNICVEAPNQPTPAIGFEIERTAQSNAEVCRDDPAAPNRRACFAWLRFEGLRLVPQAPNQVQAVITAQIRTTDIPFRYASLGMDCIVRLDSGASGTHLQDIEANALLDTWRPNQPGGGQLRISIDSVDAAIPDEDVVIARDPIHGDILDAALCGIANIGVVKNALVPLFTRSLADIVADEVDEALGLRCGRPADEPCPTGTTCNSNNFCEDPQDGRVVPTRLGLEGRLDLASLLGGVSSGRPGEMDLAFLIGGNAAADPSGLVIGALGGAEVVTADPSCAQPLPNPRQRPGWAPPPPLPTIDRVDLDFDGMPETPYMMAASLSEALFDQFAWAIHQTGVMCTRISGYDVDLLNTGSLSLLLPSLAQLTHADRWPRAIYPAAVSIYPRGEPVVRLGSGQVRMNGNTPELVEPLVELRFDDLTLSFFGVIEERWVRLLVLQVDLSLGFGAMVTPANEVQLVLSDTNRSLTDVRVIDAEILAEDPMDLEMAIPSLVAIFLPQLTGQIPTIPLPQARELGGFELDVLGVRGVREANGTYANIAVYADLDFDPTQVPNLNFASETEAHLVSHQMPSSVDFAAARGAALPRFEIRIDTEAGGALTEFQYRLNGGHWSLFHRGQDLSLQSPELSAQGRHRLEIRSRVVGDYRSLDPTPASLELLVDAEPPRLKLRPDWARGGVYVEAWDQVSQNLRFYVEAEQVREAFPEDGFIALPELANTDSISVAVADDYGHRTTQLLRAGSVSASESEADTNAEAGGCNATGTTNLSLICLALGLFFRRRA